MGASIASSVVDSVLSATSTNEVNSTVAIEVPNVRVSEVLELREVEDRSLLSIESGNSVMSGTSSVKVGDALDVSGLDLVDEVLELREVQD